MKPLEPESTPHANEVLFRRFEPDINRVLSFWPTPIKMQILTSKPSTYKANFVLVCRMLIHPNFRWQTIINIPKLRDAIELGINILVFPSDSSVTIGPVGRVSQSTEAIDESEYFRCDSHNNEALFSSLVMVKSYGIITKPLYVTSVPPGVLDTFADTYFNLDFSPAPSGAVIIT